ncbi:DUF4054 domain-containing protein [Paraburkholderia sp. G-4-1-8]|uniref:DUF4054 domain-containing protein n=1 Tax=Paraburkholderia antibiotica TaxID=2728839 RepID=A0A7Y0A1T2_9BURK|nr:DUF4054 domain-containing protein [Paraburkholderia antibiotica]NML34943.1 DUF4054 domain-containing protein [Paraburkholderia antibiotica]
MTPSQLRSDFPEFADVTIYPDSLVNMWLTVANSLVNPIRWAELTDLGIELAACHHLAISAKDQLAASVGGVPGEVKGPTASKSVDKVSVSYDTSAVTLTDAGFWNMTSYGTRFLGLARMFGAGGLQINC